MNINTSIKLPKIDENIVYHNPDSNTWYKAIVIKRTGKATGENKNCFNIKNMDRDNLLRADFKKIADWKLLNKVIIVSNSSNSNDILNAKINKMTIGKNIKFLKRYQAKVKAQYQ